MGRIGILNRELTNMISAGEVVERPASVVKELVENSIDAGAKNIVVEIKNGGKTYIRVTDDGIGMSHDDARLAFKCHATSKISRFEDLFNIKTMGFRGEAIPSIASVSKVELITCESKKKFGKRFIFDAGKEILCEDIGFAVGTTFIVTDLFYNVPARLKFLKKDSTETSNIVSLMQKLSLGHTGISFKLIVDGKQSLSTERDSELLDTIYTIYGKGITDNLLPLTLDEREISIRGYVGKPSCSRTNRNLQLFYVNGRIVKNKTIVAALDRAFHNRLMTGKYAVAIIKIDVSPEYVDVNVHPTKTEIRFTDDQKIFDATYYSIITALNSENRIDPLQETVDETPKTTEDSFFDRAVSNYYKSVRAPQPQVPAYDINDFKPTDNSSYIKDITPKIAPSPNNYFKVRTDLFDGIETYNDSEVITRFSGLPIAQTNGEYIEENQKVLASFFENDIKFKYIGELFKTYLIVECGTDFYFIDKHAAHEKILFDKIYESYKKSERYSQTLLTPISVTLTPEEKNIAWENVDKIKSLGFEFEKFGRNEVLLRSVPYVMSATDTVPTFIEIIDFLSKNKNIEITEFENNTIKMLSCKAAIKAGHETSEQELKKFIEEIIRAGNVNYCPHGRPIICHFSQKGLEKAFKRIV